jgi:hypothetical protein
MPTDQENAGGASGYAVEEDTDGGFRWSAFGPSGTLHGHADSRADAEAAAQNAESELCRSRRTER